MLQFPSLPPTPDPALCTLGCPAGGEGALLSHLTLRPQASLWDESDTKQFYPIFPSSVLGSSGLAVSEDKTRNINNNDYPDVQSSAIPVVKKGEPTEVVISDQQTPITIPQSYLSAIKRNEVLIHATTWMNPENILLSARSQIKWLRIV